MESRSNSFPTMIDLKVAWVTSDVDVDSVGHCVPLEVAGVAAVVPRLVPGDALEDETVPRNENSSADVLLHAPILNSQ